MLEHDLKRKNKRAPESVFRMVAPILMIFPAMGMIFVFVGIGLLCQIALPAQFQTLGSSVWFAEEMVEVPLNSHEPVYTRIKYSDWVAISISGSIERNGEFLFDAIHRHEDVERGSGSGFRGLLIDGKYASYFLIPTPDYRDDHIYRFPYSVYRNLRDTEARFPKTIGFQMINEAAGGLDGKFIVEISSDSFKYWPERRGR